MGGIVIVGGMSDMRKSKKQEDNPEVDPERGDAILKRMLQTKPKQHRDMVAERKTKRERKSK
jgi:hypothetical protein